MEADEVAELVATLTDPGRRVPSKEYPGTLGGLERPGLYNWWVDGAGASQLATGLGHPIHEGLLYAGQAGAGMSSRSLAERLRQHRRGKIRGSTFRRALAASLRGQLALETAPKRRLTSESERRLSDWIDEHLSIAVFPIEDRGRLLVAEALLLARLTPPLNLDGMVSTPLREHLSMLRSELYRTVVIDPPTSEPGSPLLVQEVKLPPPPAIGERIDAVPLLAGLIGRTIPTLTGKPNRILALDSETVTVATGKSPEGERVPIAWVQTALDRLVALRSIEVNVESVGYRSAFIGAVLACVPGAKGATRPRRVFFCD